MEEDMIEELVKRYIEEKREDDLSDFYAFMNTETKNALIRYYLSRQMNDELMELLSFMK